MAMMESKLCLSTPEAQAKLLDCFAEFLTHPTPNGRLHTNFQPFAATSFLNKLAGFYHNILKQSMLHTKTDGSFANKTHESFQELSRDIVCYKKTFNICISRVELLIHQNYWFIITFWCWQEESVKINSRHARKCYVTFMTSVFKIIGRFLEKQLLNGGPFEISLIRRCNAVLVHVRSCTSLFLFQIVRVYFSFRRTANDFDTIIRTATNTSNLGGQSSRFMHTTAEVFVKSPLSKIIAKAFDCIGMCTYCCQKEIQLQNFFF